MRKKVCPRPQCAKEYLEGEGFDDLTVCKLCGAPLEDVFVDDYDIEEQSDEFEENTDYETEDVICEDDMSYEEDIVDNNDIEDTEETFEDRNCFIDIDIVDDKLKSEVILAEEDVDSDENIEEDESEDIVITEANEEDEEEDESENSEEVNPYENIKGNNLILYKDNEIFKVYELKYDETIIGRNSSEFTPDIDLQEVDNENAISRKHLLVYKEDDKYYVRNLSKKCSVHIKRYDEDEPKVLSFNESVVIEDGDFIVLSGKFILEAYFNEVEE